MWKSMLKWSRNPFKTEYEPLDYLLSLGPTFLIYKEMGGCKWHLLTSCPWNRFCPHQSGTLVGGNGEKHLKVTWLFLAYFYCQREGPTSPLEIKGLFWQGNKLNNVSQRKLTSHSIPFTFTHGVNAYFTCLRHQTAGSEMASPPPPHRIQGLEHNRSPLCLCCWKYSWDQHF